VMCSLDNRNRHAPTTVLSISRIPLIGTVF